MNMWLWASYGTRIGRNGKQRAWVSNMLFGVYGGKEAAAESVPKHT